MRGRKSDRGGSERILDLRGGKTPKVSTFYQVLEFLDAGNFSEVYRALDLNSGVDVALKIYNGSDQRAAQLAASENTILRTLAQAGTGYFPKQARLYNHRVRNATHKVIVMELGGYYPPDGERRILSVADIVPAAGETAAEKQVSEFWGEEALVPWVIDLCMAVRALHRGEAPIIHRDIKPANILLKRSPGAQRSVPFLIDFNTSQGPGSHGVRGGTQDYLPPEVRTGNRSEPDITDDLWAAARLIWEILFGRKSELDPGARPHGLIGFPVPEALPGVLLRALAMDPADRYGSAEDLLEAVRGACEDSPEPIEGEPAPLSSDQLAWARERWGPIREDVAVVLAGPDELPVPKSVNEAVGSLLAWIGEEQQGTDTKVLNLREELVELGPKAIPAILDQGFRLVAGSPEQTEVARAIATLAESDRALAVRCVDEYCVSSNFVVRQLCQLACRALKHFPSRLLDVLGDESDDRNKDLFLRGERQELVGLCIECSTDKNRLMVLTTYMCRLYIPDPDTYFDLRNDVARRLAELDFKSAALFLVQEASSHTWRGLLEFKDLPPDQREYVERGLIQLFADAFAGVGAEALDLLKAGSVPSYCKCPNRHLPIFGPFISRLLGASRRAQEWAAEELRKPRPDKRLIRAAERSKVSRLVVQARGLSGSGSGEVAPIDTPLPQLLSTYVRTKGRDEYNTLRFQMGSRAQTLFGLISSMLEANPGDSTVRALLDLLRGFEAREVDRVASCVCSHWDRFAGVDYKQAVRLLSRHRIHRHEIRRQAIDILQSNLNKQGDEATLTRKSLERLLSWGDHA